MTEMQGALDEIEGVELAVELPDEALETAAERVSPTRLTGRFPIC